MTVDYIRSPPPNQRREIAGDGNLNTASLLVEVEHLYTQRCRLTLEGPVTSREHTHGGDFELVAIEKTHQVQDYTFRAARTERGNHLKYTKHYDLSYLFDRHQSRKSRPRDQPHTHPHVNQSVKRFQR